MNLPDPLLDAIPEQNPGIFPDRDASDLHHNGTVYREVRQCAAQTCRTASTQAGCRLVQWTTDCVYARFRG